MKDEDTKINKVNIKKQKIPIPWHIYLSLTLITFLVIGTMWYSLSKGNLIAAKHAPLVDATMEIKLETTLGHLWFEEIMSGDRSLNIKDVWKHFDQAIWYAKAMLEGGQNPEGTFIPLANLEMQKDIGEVLVALKEFKKTAEARFETIMNGTSGIGTDIDQRFDTTFNAFMQETDDVETQLQKLMKYELERFRITQYLLIATTLVLALIIGIILHLFIRRRAMDFIAVNEAIDEAATNEEHLMVTLRSIGDGVITTDAEGKVLLVNKVAEELTGWTQEEANEKPLTEVFTIINEKTRKPCENPVQKVMERGVVVGLANHTVLISRDGTERVLDDSAAPLKDKINKIIGVVLVFRDITERKRADEELTKLATAIKQAQETVMILGTDGVITYVNPALEEQMGYSSSELMGTNLIPRDRRSDQKNLFQKAWKTINEGNVWAGHMSPTSKDGSIREFDVTISPIRDSSEKITSFVSIARNVTKELEMEERLRRAEKMEAIGTLAGGVAHDLNNVLGGIVGYPDLLLHDIPEDSPMRRSLMAIKQSGLRASAIVQDLLTLARRGVQITEVVNLNTILTKCLESVEYKKLEEFHPDVKVETCFAKDLLNIMGSPVHLSKTVINLLSNASEAMSGGGKITILSENRYLDKPIKGYDSIKEGDYVVLSVKDNGTGIASEDLDKIFEPFYTKKVMGRSGTGLGMAVVWGTVKDHQGYIDVESIEGQGTTFTLYFPVTREEVESVKEPVSIEEYSGNGEKILIVDDVEAQRDIAANLLKKLNYTVETVASGEEALEYMRKNTADLLVLDMIMDPGIDGLDTYKRIIEINPGQKEIITSGFSETDRVREAQKLGAGAYIRKPYTLEKIGLAVKTELEGRS